MSTGAYLRHDRINVFTHGLTWLTIRYLVVIFIDGLSHLDRLRYQRCPAVFTTTRLGLYPFRTIRTTDQVRFVFRFCWLHRWQKCHQDDAENAQQEADDEPSNHTASPACCNDGGDDSGYEPECDCNLHL